MDDPNVKLVESLAGRTIVRARWNEPPEGDDQEAWLWLDDGRVIAFGGWGHDYWGGTVDEIKVVDVERCLSCGQPHADLRVFRTGPPDAEIDVTSCPNKRNATVRDRASVTPVPSTPSEQEGNSA